MGEEGSRSSWTPPPGGRRAGRPGPGLLIPGEHWYRYMAGTALWEFPYTFTALFWFRRYILLLKERRQIDPAYSKVPKIFSSVMYCSICIKCLLYCYSDALQWQWSLVSKFPVIFVIIQTWRHGLEPLFPKYYVIKFLAHNAKALTVYLRWGYPHLDWHFGTLCYVD